MPPARNPEAIRALFQKCFGTDIDDDKQVEELARLVNGGRDRQRAEEKRVEAREKFRALVKGGFATGALLAVATYLAPGVIKWLADQWAWIIHRAAG